MKKNWKRIPQTKQTSETTFLRPGSRVEDTVNIKKCHFELHHCDSELLKFFKIIFLPNIIIIINNEITNFRKKYLFKFFPQCTIGVIT